MLENNIYVEIQIEKIENWNTNSLLSFTSIALLVTSLLDSYSCTYKAPPYPYSLMLVIRGFEIVQIWKEKKINQFFIFRGNRYYSRKLTMCSHLLVPSASNSRVSAFLIEGECPSTLLQISAIIIKFPKSFKWQQNQFQYSVLLHYCFSYYVLIILKKYVLDCTFLFY